MIKHMRINLIWGILYIILWFFLLFLKSKNYPIIIYRRKYDLKIIIVDVFPIIDKDTLSFSSISIFLFRYISLIHFIYILLIVNFYYLNSVKLIGYTPLNTAHDIYKNHTIENCRYILINFHKISSLNKNQYLNFSHI